MILDKKMVNRQNKAVTKVLVQWKGLPAQQATWEFYQDFIAKFRHFQISILEAKDVLKEGVL